MKLLSNNIVTLGLFGKIFNNVGEELVFPNVIFTPKETDIIINKVSRDTFSIVTPTNLTELKLGESIKVIQPDFDIELIITNIGHNIFKVKKKFEDKTYDYDENEDNNIYIPDGATIIHRELDIILPMLLEGGEYYSDFGEVLLVGDNFQHLNSISSDDIYTLKPELRGKAIEPYELENMINLAKDFVFEDLEGLESDDNDRFKYLNIDGIKKLILYRTISIYESSFPNEKGEYSYIYGRKYKSAINGFSPYKRIDSTGKIEKAEKKGIRY